MRASGEAFFAAVMGTLVIGLAGCSPSGGNTTVVAASAVAPQSAAPGASTASGAAASGEAPGAFVQRLFAVYAADSKWWAEPDTAAERKAYAAYQSQVYADFYDPTFVKLMDDNGALAGKKGSGVDLDYDPVCQCQDSGTSYRYLSGAQSGSFYDAKVTDSEPSQQPWTLVLEQTARGWRIYDVLDSTGSIRTRLTRHNACLSAAKTEKQGEACIA